MGMEASMTTTPAAIMPLCHADIRPTRPDRPNRAVITYGTFDRFDAGHARELARICEMGTTIIVGVSTDEFAARKGEPPIARYAERVARIRTFPGVDTVIPETGWEQRVLDLLAYDIDVLVVGFGCRSRCEHLAGLCEIRYLDGSVRATGGADASVTAVAANMMPAGYRTPEPVRLATWEPQWPQPAKPVAHQRPPVTRERLAATYAAYAG